DLISRVLLGGPAIGAGRDRHHGALRAGRLLQHPEESAAVLVDGVELGVVPFAHGVRIPFCTRTTPSQTSCAPTNTARPCSRPTRSCMRYCQKPPARATSTNSVPSYV